MFNVEKLHEELSAAGLPVIGCDSNGRVTYLREISQAEQDLVKTVKKNHDPQDEKELTDKELLDALWKKVVDGDDTDIIRLGAIRTGRTE